MSDNELNVLQAIMVEEDDLDLFPDRVVTLHEQGKGLTAHATLRRHAGSVRDKQRRERLQHYLSILRLWAVSVSKPPNLFTFNGIGTRLYGNAQPGDDGTRISTVWFTVFWVPVFPNGSYVVEPAEEGSWYFHGRTPHPPWVRIPTRLWAAAVALLLGFAAFQAFDGAMNADVVMYNGFASPVEVRTGDQTWAIDPGDHVEVRLPAETTVMTAGFVDEPPFETVTLGLSEATWRDTVYNVGGRRILVLEHWSWGPEEPDEDELLYGSVNVVDPVEYVFEAPPEQRSVQEGDTLFSTALAAIPEQSATSLLTHLLSNAGPESATAYARSAVLDGVTEPMVTSMAMSAETDETRTPRDVCAEWLGRHSDSVELHRFCQDVRQDEIEAVGAEYETLAEGSADSAMLAYLAGRVAPGDRGRRWLEESLKRDPDYARAHLAIAYDALTRTGDLTQCEEHARRAIELDPGLAPQGTDLLARALKLQDLAAHVVAERLPELDDSVFTLQDMLRLAADPSTLGAEWSRLETATASMGDSRDPRIASLFGSVALVAGDLGRLRSANANGAGLELELALSEGATPEDQAWTPDENRWFGGADAVLAYLLAERQQRDPTAVLGGIAEAYPELAAFLQAEPSPSVAEVAERLLEVDPALHGATYFLYYQRTGNPEFARRAKRWALPQELPHFTAAGPTPR